MARSDDEDAQTGEERQRLAPRNRLPGELAEEGHLSAAVWTLASGVGRTVARRQPLHHDVREEARPHRAKGIGMCRHVLPQQLAVGCIVQRGTGATRRCDPRVELVLGHRIGVEMHIGEAVAADHRGLAAIGARAISLEIEGPGHAVHAVEHAAELRNPERVPHGRRGHGEV